MKRPYANPKIEYVRVQSNQNVSDICWAYAKNGKTFYYNVPGYGYAILHVSGKSCDSGVVFQVEFSDPENMTPEEIAAGNAYMQDVINEARATSGNSAEPFSGSPFVATPDPSWS